MSSSCGQYGAIISRKALALVVAAAEASACVGSCSDWALRERIALSAMWMAVPVPLRLISNRPMLRFEIKIQVM